MSDVRTKVERLKALLFEACEIGDVDLAHSTVDELAELFAEKKTEPPKSAEKVPQWNEDPEWLVYCGTMLEPMVRKITKKYTTDSALREDCEQEAREAIYQIFPSKVRDWELFQSGQITAEAWNSKLKSYCQNTIRNAILSYLDSPKTGSWYIGRTRRVKNNQTGLREKVRVGARYSSFDELTENHGLQVDEFGEISWDKVSTDGTLNDERSLGWVNEQ
jgi:hypothetical protein